MLGGGVTPGGGVGLPRGVLAPLRGPHGAAGGLDPGGGGGTGTVGPDSIMLRLVDNIRYRSGVAGEQSPCLLLARGGGWLWLRDGAGPEQIIQFLES